MRILVVGSAGYLGHHVTEILGQNCVAYDSLMYVSDYHQRVKFVRGDVTDYDTLQAEIDKSDIVVWLAAIVGDGACAENPDRAIAINQGAVRYLAEHSGCPIIFTSTASTYGIFDGIATVDSPLAPVSLYAETKIRAEEYLRKRGNACIFRLGTLHGVSQRMRFDLVVNGMTRNAVLNGVVRVYGGSQYRPLLSVKDAAHVIANVALNWGGNYDGTFNLASENLSILHVGQIVQEVVPEAELQVIESESQDRRNYRVACAPLFEPMLSRTCAISAQDIVALLRSGRLRDPRAAHYGNT